MPSAFTIYMQQLWAKFILMMKIGNVGMTDKKKNDMNQAWLHDCTAGNIGLCNLKNENLSYVFSW